MTDVVVENPKITNLQVKLLNDNIISPVKIFHLRFHMMSMRKLRPILHFH